MEIRNPTIGGNNNETKGRASITRIFQFMKRRLRLNRFLLVIDTKKGVTISAISVIVFDLIDLLWNLSMSFGPLNSTMTSLLLLETFLVICVSSVLLYAMKLDNKPDLRSVLLAWLLVVAIDYLLRASMIFSSLIISEKASTTAKAMKTVASIVMLVLVAHCWLCVFTYYDDNNGKITTVKITPSDDKGRMLLNKRPMMMMKTSNIQELSSANLDREYAGNMLRAPTEDATKSRCNSSKLIVVNGNPVSAINQRFEIDFRQSQSSSCTQTNEYATSYHLNIQTNNLEANTEFQSSETINNTNQLAFMADLLQYIIVDFWRENGDPKAEDYFWLRGGPWLTWLATAAYLYIVLKAGPDFMRNRKPYDLKISIRLYNLLLVAINTYLFIGSVRSFRYGLDYWGCSSVTIRGRQDLLYYGHLFFHTRYLEFFDTFFFILRKKTSQISFLHVFHHGVVPTLMYVGLKFYPVAFNALLPTTNMFVHIIMYAYYGLATFGPGMQKYLWWKRYLTTIQISQFALLLMHCLHPLLYQPDCTFPPGLVMINSGIALTFLFLFISFYRQTYNNKTLPKSGSTQQVKVGAAENGSRKLNLAEAPKLEQDYGDREKSKQL